MPRIASPLAILARLIAVECHHRWQQRRGHFQDCLQIAFSRLTSLGNNWQSETLSVRFRSSQCKTEKVHFDSTGVENPHFTEEIERLPKRAWNGLRNRCSTG